MISFVQMIRQKVQSIVDREQSVWKTFLQHSEAYSRILKLEQADLEALQREQGRGSMHPDLKEIASKGFLHVTVDGEEFSLSTKHVCGGPYGGDWVDTVFAICTSNQTLNESVGDGTTFITVIPVEWYVRLKKHLEKCESNQVTL